MLKDIVLFSFPVSLDVHASIRYLHYDSRLWLRLQALLNVDGRSTLTDGKLVRTVRKMNTVLQDCALLKFLS